MLLVPNQHIPEKNRVTYTKEIYPFMVSYHKIPEFIEADKKGNWTQFPIRLQILKTPTNSMSWNREIKVSLFLWHCY